MVKDSLKVLNYLSDADLLIADDLVKSQKTVTPAEAGVQNCLDLLDSRFHGNDKIGEITTSYETIIVAFNTFHQEIS